MPMAIPRSNIGAQFASFGRSVSQFGKTADQALKAAELKKKLKEFDQFKQDYAAEVLRDAPSDQSAKYLRRMITGIETPTEFMEKAYAYERQKQEFQQNPQGTKPQFGMSLQQWLTLRNQEQGQQRQEVIGRAAGRAGKPVYDSDKVEMPGYQQSPAGEAPPQMTLFGEEIEPAPTSREEYDRAMARELTREGVPRGTTADDLKDNPQYALGRQGLPSQSQLLRERKEERIANNQENRSDERSAEQMFKRLRLQMQDEWKRAGAREDLMEVIAGYETDISQLQRELKEAENPTKKDEWTGQTVPPDPEKATQIRKEINKLKEIMGRFQELYGERSLPTGQAGSYSVGARGRVTAGGQTPAAPSPAPSPTPSPAATDPNDPLKLELPL